MDAYTAGEESFWTGQLNGGDYVVAFLNTGPLTANMSATMDDVFVDKITTGSNAPVPQLTQTWDVYDLWANRMSDEAAQAIISANSTLSDTNSTTAYNSTQTSYGNGVTANSTALLGAKTTTFAPKGTLSATVPSHGIVVYRLRSQGSGGKRKRDEL